MVRLKSMANRVRKDRPLSLVSFEPRAEEMNHEYRRLSDDEAADCHAEQEEEDRKGKSKCNDDSEDEEDVADRFEYEVDEAVDEFVDKLMRERDSIPDSSDDEDDMSDLKEKRKRNKMKTKKLGLGYAFMSGLEFKEAVLQYAITKGKNIVQSRWEKKKLSFKCGMGGKCQWRVYCSFDEPKQLWFIQLIKKDLSLEDGTRFVLISDRSKGLISAVKQELPGAEHRMCVKHIVENLKKNHAKKDMMKPLIWQLAWSYNPTVFEENLQKIRSYNYALYEDVMKEEPKQYLKLIFNLFCNAL